MQEEIEAYALAAAEVKAAMVVEKKMKAEQAIAWLAALYQPVDVVNMTPQPTDNAFDVHEAQQLSGGEPAYCQRGNTYGPSKLQMPHFLQ